MLSLKPRLLPALTLLFLLFTGFACSPSLDTLVKKARAAAKDTPPRRADTTVIILPELLLFKEDAAAHNATSYNVICLDKQGIATNTLAEIKRCECQLYQQEDGQIKRMRVLWAAEPIDDWTWKRTYFDENGDPKTEDKLRVTAPYKFIYINNITTWGNGYVHEEYKMYFEMKVVRRPSSRI